ncbi:D-lactate dehydrogenase [Psittacicella hinzii]|uniref:D-lactate dehydrogenase n=1 Tax=Psittacicella hinzii TaxID=2028575 RepID=A0A3A1Y5I1_9GAMM|nr:D-lactate dehydrogenase [Psittacicella hinzii]RIY31304.1 D-lactate dehydrogenase [Psittacicella hinzii]
MNFDKKEYSGFINKIEDIVGKSHCITDATENARFRKGIRYGEGETLAVVRPKNLVEYYKVVKLAAENDVIVISQAANTGLTGGSTPFGNDYDRPNIVINTLRIDNFKIINNQTQVVCLSGATLYKLEDELAKIGREPHSVIGSSCIGASVIGGVCNNSGGSLVQRGPSFTEYACYARINEKGEFEFINNLGIDFGSEDPLVILEKLQNGDYSDGNIVDNSKRASSTDYKEKVVLVDEDTPARYNNDPERLKEASGSAGHLAVFAVRLDTFEKPKRSQMFYIGSNDINVLTDVRRAALTEFDGRLPISGEYIHKEAYAIGKKYGKDTLFVIDKFGTKYIPKLYALKAFYDRTIGKIPGIPNSDRLLQGLSALLPNLLTEKMEEYHKLYEHHLLLVVGDNMIDDMNKWLEDYFNNKGKDNGGFFKCTPKEAKIAGLHRFSIAGAAIRYRECHPKEVDICAIDVALRRNDSEWFEHLPEEIEAKLAGKLYYGHFLCHVFHQDYMIKKPLDPLAVEEEILETLKARGAQYPAEHNVGHLYHAQEPLVKHYKTIDPTNSFNPGVGKTTKLKNWAEGGCNCGHEH